MYSSRRQGQGPPGWFVFLIGLALVFGGYRLWTGVQQFFAAGGLPLPDATATAIVATQGAASRATSALATRFPTMTPQPECQDYRVRPNAGVVNVRRQPATIAAVEDTLQGGDVVCMIELQGEWYLIDRDTRTRRIEPGYIFATLLVPANPTSTPSSSPTPAPTITLTPTHTATPTLTPSETLAP